MSEPTERTILFAGGGTGGHLFPGLAVAEALTARSPRTRIVFAGSGRPIEARILDPTGYERVALPAESLRTLRRNPVRFAWRNWSGYRAALRLVERTRPAIVIGLGGFASVAVVLAARTRRVPIVLLEQNALPGRANRWLSPRADVVCTMFPPVGNEWPSQAHVVVAGNPVRRAIADLHRTPSADDAARADPSRRRTLLVLGGSQGASPVNRAVCTAAESLRPALGDWRIVHQTGTDDVAAVRANYLALSLDAEVGAFFDDLPALYAQADLAVSRAGATTLAELACAGCPAALIPYPLAADDHQRLNAERFAADGAAWLVPQRTEAETAQRLIEVVGPLLTGGEALAEARRAMRSLARPDAAARVVDRIEAVVAGEGGWGEDRR